MIQPTIQNFTSADTTGASTQQCAFDWTHLYPFHGASPFGITRFDFTTGTQISTGSLPGTSEPDPVYLDPLGFLYYRHDLSNFNGVTQVDGSTYLLTRTFGSDSGFNNMPNGIPLPGFYTAVTVGAVEWLICIGVIPIGTFQHSVNALRAGSVLTFGGHNFEMLGGQWSVCTGPQGNLTSTAYTLAGPSSLKTTPMACELYATTILASASSYNPTSWPLANPGISTVLVGSILPTDIDPTWTQMRMTGVCYDATDGNLLAFMFDQTEVVAQPNYVVKIDASDATIKWKVPITGMVNGYGQMPLSRIRHGTFACAVLTNSIKQVFIINTITGTYSSFTNGLAGVLGINTGQCYDDTTGAIVLSCQFNETVDSPTRLNSTPSTFNGWAALYVQPVYSPPPRVETRVWSTTYLPRFG